MVCRSHGSTELIMTTLTLEDFLNNIKLYISESGATTFCMARKNHKSFCDRSGIGSGIFKAVQGLWHLHKALRFAVGQFLC